MRIQGLTISEALGDIRSEYLLEAEEAYFVAITQKRHPSRNGWLTRFVNSGWGVAIICALVAVSVMGGIIWAGNRPDGPGIRPPVGNQYTEDLSFEQETMETIEPPAAEIAAKAPEIAWEKPIKSVQTTAFYSMVTYNMIAVGDNQITEISLATHEDDTRTLMFRLINRETYEVMARYSWDATEGKWGVMTVEEGLFLVYRATEQGAMTTLWIDFFVWLPELDPATYECVGSFYPKILPESRPYLWKHPRVEETGEWGRFVKELFTDFPTTYLCMDEALGDLAFYTEDNRYTDGWERMRLFWQDLYILDGEEATRGSEIVTEKAKDSLPSISEMNIHRVSYIEYDADFLLPVAEEAAAHITESALPVYRSNDEKPTGEGCLRFVAIPEETLGYYGYRIERTEQAITLYAASPNGSMEAFVYLAESFVTGYEDGYYLIFEDKDFLPIGSTIEVRE